MIRFLSTMMLLFFFSLSLQAAKIKVHFVDTGKNPVTGVHVRVAIANPLPPKVGEVMSVTHGSMSSSSSGGASSSGSSAASGPAQMVGQQNGILIANQGGKGSGGADEFSPDANRLFISDKKGEIVFGALLPGSYKIVAEKKGYGLIAGKPFEMTKKDQELTIILYSAADAEKFGKLQTEGNDALSAQNYVVAAARYEEMAKIMPDEPIIYSNLAKAYAGQNDWDKAVPAAQKAAELNNTEYGQLSKTIQSLGLYSNAMRLINQQNYLKAIDTLTQAAAIDNTNPEIYYGLAMANLNQKNYAEGEKCIEQALKIKPSDEIYLGLQKMLKNRADAANK